jgi:hypothetical protein
LHLVDGDVEDETDLSGVDRSARSADSSSSSSSRAARLKRRWTRTAKALLGRFEEDPPSILRRTILAALARALDALVRAGACDVSDVLLVVARKMTDATELDTLAEASMDPDLIHVLQRYAEFVRGAAAPVAPARKPNEPPPSLSPSAPLSNLQLKLKALESLSNELSPDASTRTEALRTVIVRLHAALNSVLGAASLLGWRLRVGRDRAARVGALGTRSARCRRASAARPRPHHGRRAGDDRVPAAFGGRLAGARRFRARAERARAVGLRR